MGPPKEMLLLLLLPWRRRGLSVTALSSTLVSRAMRSARRGAAEVSSGAPTAAVSCFVPPVAVVNLFSLLTGECDWDT